MILLVFKRKIHEFRNKWIGIVKIWGLLLVKMMQFVQIFR